MSVDADSGISLVYVGLLNEGTVVYRPASAVALRPGIVKLVAPGDYDPDDETWEFEPGSVVRVEPKTLEGKEVRVAVSLVE
jgi:hypothetical protein